MKNLSDNQIIESILKGNHSDYALLIDRYKDRAFSLLKRMLKDEMDAEEALQDSFLKAFNSLKDFRKESKFSTWFYKIVYNTALTVITKKKRQIEKQMLSIDEDFELKDDNQAYSTSNDAKEFVLKMIDKLPPRNALVVILFYIDNLSLDEISKVLDISIVNTKVMLHRSRNALRDILIKHNYHEEIL